MGKKRDKAKRRKFIAKISADGKITKKEARKAAKKGISLRKIENRRVSEFRDAQRDYRERADERRPTKAAPTYEPLKIKRGAERADFARQMREYGGRTQQPRRPRRGGGQPSTQPSTQPTNQYQSEIQDILNGEPDQMVSAQPVADPVGDALAALEQTIAGLSFEQPDYGAEFEAMRAEQDRRMAEYEARRIEADRERELAMRTYQENAARGGLTPDFRIGARSPRDRMGTGGFKRRPRRRAAVVAQGITPAQQAVNNMVPNTLQTRGINLATIPTTGTPK